MTRPAGVDGSGRRRAISFEILHIRQTIGRERSASSSEEESGSSVSVGTVGAVSHNIVFIVSLGKEVLHKIGSIIYRDGRYRIGIETSQAKVDVPRGSVGRNSRVGPSECRRVGSVVVNTDIESVRTVGDREETQVIHIERIAVSIDNESDAAIAVETAKVGEILSVGGTRKIGVVATVAGGAATQRNIDIEGVGIERVLRTYSYANAVMVEGCCCGGEGTHPERELFVASELHSGSLEPLVEGSLSCSRSSTIEICC